MRKTASALLRSISTALNGGKPGPQREVGELGVGQASGVPPPRALVKSTPPEQIGNPSPHSAEGLLGLELFTSGPSSRWPWGPF